MNIIIALPLAVIPALFLVWYYYKQDKQKPEPKGLITKIFGFGVVATIPIIIAEFIVIAQYERYFSDSPLGYYFFKAFIVAALCEEGFKFLIVKQFAYNNVHFDEAMDGIVYTIVASLGFACLENILYVVEGGIGVAILRAFTAVPMHALAAGVMGYYIGKAKFAPEPKENVFFVKGLLLAIFIHGLYDFFLFSMPVLGEIWGFAIFPLLIIVFIILRGKIKSALKEDMAAGRVSGGAKLLWNMGDTDDDADLQE